MAVGVVTWCWRHGAIVAGLAVLLALPAGWLAVTGLGLDSDESHMLSPDLPYRRAELRFDAAFPHTTDLLVAVIDADTSEQADTAADGLVARLAGHPLFHSVERTATELFLRDHALLYLSEAELEEVVDRLIRAQPLLGGLAADPSARGLLAVVALLAEGVRRGEAEPAQVAPLVEQVAATARAVLDGRSRPLSLLGLLAGGGADTRRLVLTRPRLDHGGLVPGEAAARALRLAAEGLPGRLRLTGPVALADDNFRTVAEGVAPTLALSLTLVTALLVVAVGSLRVAGAILVTLAVGLVTTAAFAAVAVGTLNPLSVAFVVLFLGLAVDFAIQFALRFRADHHRLGDADAALAGTAAKLTRPLLVVAAATALGFLAFVPTRYSGVSQLGLIAGGGMMIGVGLTLTLLPALLRLVRPPPARRAPGFAFLAPVEAHLRRHARTVLALTALVVAVAAVLALRLRADFDPLALQDPRAPSVATFRDLAADPATSPLVVQALTADGATADALAARLGGRDDIAFALSPAALVPSDQAVRLAVVADLDRLLGASLHPPATLAPPDLAALVAVLGRTATALEGGGFAEAAGLLRAVVARGRTQVFADAAAGGLGGLLDRVRRLLAVQPVTAAELPPAVRREWIGTGGEGRVEIHPAAPLSTPAAMAAFVGSLRPLGAELSGAPVAMVEGGRAVVGAFVQAGLTALAAVVLLLALVLRRITDVGLVLLPPLLGGVLTLATLALGGVAITLANIIAFPLLLGIAVAANIYFVLGWRGGMPVLPSATARAVLFSALTTGMSFGALALSPHRGTASLGLVLVVGLAVMVAVALVVLPAAFALLERRRP